MEWIILIAVLLDLLIGDPPNMPHPVIWIGKAIQSCETVVHRFATSPRALQIGGSLMVLVVVVGTYLITWGIMVLAYLVHAYLGVAVSILLMSQTLAINSLYRHAQQVLRPLQEGRIQEARRALAMIVGRDTDSLDEAQLIRGTVETVAENTVDGITAPLFYGFLGGPALAMAYKAVNTLDSMVGYKNERYRYLGWAAARLDDAANYIPARLTGLLYLFLAPFTRGGLRGVVKTMWHDAPRHPSPNSGIPEAAVAGALGIQLGGLNYYGGIASPRALIGEPLYPLENGHIRQSLNIMLLISLEAVAVGMLLSLCWG
ncbi:MAG: cobalamin biosynthesis protein CobD [Syntrophomonadaceae bacterium]|jgi:adenosylcobinamide-phosphate synthase|nr:cobalamin biosynthesis protein CobD [Syntrophomonadaceae bacterium]